jgi:hypothetical protein
MRQMMDVSIPVRAWCIGDGIPDSQGYSYILGEACYCLDGSSITIYLLYCIRH